MANIISASQEHLNYLNLQEKNLRQNQNYKNLKKNTTPPTKKSQKKLKTNETVTKLLCGTKMLTYEELRKILGGKSHENYHNYRHDYFSWRIVSYWNRLPSDIVNAVWVNSFKNHLDRHW